MMQKGVEVNLPASRRADKMTEDAAVCHRAAVLSPRISRVYIDDESVPVDVLAERVRQAMQNADEKDVFLRGDGGVQLQDLMDVIDRLKDGGIETRRHRRAGSGQASSDGCRLRSADRRGRPSPTASTACWAPRRSRTSCSWRRWRSCRRLVCRPARAGSGDADQPRRPRVGPRDGGWRRWRPADPADSPRRRRPIEAGASAGRADAGDDRADQGAAARRPRPTRSTPRIRAAARRPRARRCRRARRSPRPAARARASACRPAAAVAGAIARRRELLLSRVPGHDDRPDHAQLELEAAGTPATTAMRFVIQRTAASSTCRSSSRAAIRHLDYFSSARARADASCRRCPAATRNRR